MMQAQILSVRQMQRTMCNALERVSTFTSLHVHLRYLIAGAVTTYLPGHHHVPFRLVNPAHIQEVMPQCFEEQQGNAGQALP